MKNFLRVLALFSGAIALSHSVSAQLPAGSIAPDLTLTDLNGETHKLYDYLSDGYTVFLDFSATWCGPCWNYHISGALEDLYANHGPAGMPGVSAGTTDDVMVFFIEGDPTTTLQDLQGTGNNTLGNWIQGTLYPIADDAMAAATYSVAYYPTLYRVCPNKRVWEVNQDNAATQYNSINSCPVATSSNDAELLAYTGTTWGCESVEVEVILHNKGTQPITTKNIDVLVNNNTLLSYTWNGYLESYQHQYVTVGELPISANTDFIVDITDSDNSNGNNDVDASVLYFDQEGTSRVNIEILTDCWPGETSWSIIGPGGWVYASGGPYEAGETIYSHSVLLPVNGCLAFIYRDAYGDGMFGSQWADLCSANGYVKAWNTTDGNDIHSWLVDYDGSYNTIGEANGFYSSVVNIAPINLNESSFEVFPNPTSDIASVVYNLESAERITLSIYNVLGELVESSDFGIIGAGVQRYDVDLSSEPSGIYFVNLTAGDKIFTKKVTLTK